jgi:alkylated DNA nucleotide flippase Atl1
MARRKTWREKLLDSKGLPKVVKLNENARKHWKADTMAIPSPMEVNDIMSGVPEGSLITIAQIREIVARKHGADIGCPLTCGIFSWIAAHAAVEQAEEGRTGMIPYWRTLKTSGELNPKYPGGIEEQKKRLEAEGFTVIPKAKRYVVRNYQKYI